MYYNDIQNIEQPKICLLNNNLQYDRIYVNSAKMEFNSSFCVLNNYIEVFCNGYQL